MDHTIVYEKNSEAVCSCGTVLSTYGRITTVARLLGEHIREARTREALDSVVEEE
jgi:hypothetical protein